MSAGAACPKCGHGTEPEDRFCSRCGQPLVPWAGTLATARPGLESVFSHLRAGEQRPATILMADLSGFTALGEATGPERLYDMINEVFRELVECLVAHGAHIDKYIGDEIMALFGVPLAQERSVERAVRAALALRERMEGLNREGRFGDVRLGLHTGINVGPVMVGPVGHFGHADYTVIGDTVNVTKRLEDEAPTGEIYVSQQVAEAVAGLFDLEEIGPLQLSGRRGEVVVYRVLGAAGLADGGADPSVPLVGREAEMVSLSSAARRALAGEPVVVHVVGPAGIGKSQLIAEWVGAPGASEFRVVRSTCHTFGRHFALLPVVQIVAACLGLRLAGWPPRVSGDLNAALGAVGLPGSVCDVLRRLLTEYGSDGDMGREDWRAWLPVAVRALLRRLAERDPLCLVIEDVQWLDEASGSVLSDALRGRPDRPVLVIASSREPLEHRFPVDLNPEILCVAALPAEAMRDLVGQWAGPEAMPSRIAARICERAEGHPYFAREMVAALRASVDGSGTQSVPPNLQELFLAQLDWLPTPLRGLVQAASVLGEPVSTGILVAVIEHDEGTDALVEEAVRRGLLRPGGESGLYYYARRLLFEAAYTTIPPMRRKALHAGIADHITIGLRDRGPWAIHAAAHHAYLGYGDERALPLLLQSAKRHGLQYANRQAIQDASRALEIIEAAGRSSKLAGERIEALWQTAQAHTVLGENGPAELALAEAQSLIEDHGDKELVGRVLLSAATLKLMQGDAARARQGFGLAMEAWTALGDETRMGHTLIGRSMCATLDGNRAAALALLSEATALTGAAPWVLAAAWNNIGILHLHEGRYSEAEAALDAALAANAQAEDRRGIAHTKASIGELRYRMGRLREAEDALRAALQVSTEIEDPQCRSLAGLLLARVLVLGDDLLGAREACGGVDADEEYGPETAWLRALVACELDPSRPSSPQVLEGIPACGETDTAACADVALELACVLLENALVGQREGDAHRLREVVRARLVSCADRHLQAYAQWLQAVGLEPARAAAPACDPHGQTIFDVRASRLLDALRRRSAPDS